LAGRAPDPATGAGAVSSISAKAPRNRAGALAGAFLWPRRGTAGDTKPKTAEKPEISSCQFGREYRDHDRIALARDLGERAGACADLRKPFISPRIEVKAYDAKSGGDQP